MDEKESCKYHMSRKGRGRRKIREEDPRENHVAWPERRRQFERMATLASEKRYCNVRDAYRHLVPRRKS
jgi:hypothetical protein